MIKKYSWTIIFSLFLSLLICCKPKYNNKTAKKPNIILINVDDLGWKDLGVMGSSYYETPNINALAKQGLTFTNAYAGAANCAPSRACLISGLNTPRHGVFTVSPSDRGHKKTRKLIPIQNTKHLNNSIYTLPEMLKSSGYLTANFGKWHVGANPNKQGIDYNIGGSDRGNPGKDGYFSPYNIDFIKNGPNGEYLTDRLTNEAITFMQKAKDTSFFVYLPYYSVHTPLLGKRKLIEKYKNKKGDNKQNNATYAAMIESMDENVGKVLHALKAYNLEKNTLVIFTSDNGGIRQISNQDPLRAGKGSYYEGGIRVPLIIKWPKHITPNTVSHQIVSQLDFYPTLQAITKPKKSNTLLDGIDLNPILHGETTKVRELYFHFPVYLQNYSKGNDGSRDPLFRTRPGSVIISGSWKLHHYYEDNALELYNLKDDLSEQHNLADLNPQKTKELYKKLDAWRLKTNAPTPTEKNPYYSSDFEKDKIISFNK
ncbi:MAG: sulfatase [Algibacter sp.]|uniref:sulfatase n=1 Tax=Algibacter sp. TaxID=1872428 RepID=UPI00329A4102